MVEARFVDLAMSIGVAGKIATLTADCDRAIADLAHAEDQRWSWRLESQRRLLLNPSLRALVALTTRLAEENPDLTAPVAPVMAELAAKHPEFAPYHLRILRQDASWALGGARGAATP